VEWKWNFVLSGVETEFRFGVLETEVLVFGVSETKSFGVSERIVSVSWKQNSVSV
jgi:hypothetical protein